MAAWWHGFPSDVSLRGERVVRSASERGLFFTGGQRPLPTVSAPRTKDMASVDLRSRILIVEDEVMIAWMIESLLEDMGFENVEIAGSGEEAFSAVAGARPALIVSDINLGSQLDGIAVAERINADGFVPVLFVSGYADDRARARIDATFATAKLLRKPVEPALLRSAIISVLTK